MQQCPDSVMKKMLILRKMNKSMDMSAENVIENWANYVNQSDLPGLMGLYAKDATLVPTFSRKILHTPEEIEQYFWGLPKRELL